MPLRNRVALLTGAAGGIGRVMTRALLDDGHSVAAVDRDADSLERLKSKNNSTKLHGSRPIVQASALRAALPRLMGGPFC
jgi:NADP-dependent 3-hydroxy acid dehydrogenase YdfG